MPKGYQQGHPYYPRKDGSPPPGVSKAKHRAAMNASLAVRERLDPVALVEFHLAILAGQDPVIEEYEDDDGTVCQRVVWSDGGGIKPTLEQKMRAAKELWDRGHGLPAQSIQLEGQLRAHVAQLAGTIDIGALGPAGIIGLRRFLEGATSGGHADQPALPAPAPAPASTDDEPAG